MGDVARLAGVSHQTVSRVVNDAEHVSAKTRARVLDAMEKLGYRPSSIARALVTGRSNTVGVVSFDTTLHGPASTMFGIERAAHRAGYFTTIVSHSTVHRSTLRSPGWLGRAWTASWSSPLRSRGSTHWPTFPSRSRSSP
jgi:DNA-binding LacI/PurR family transcriptional regulator